MVYNPEKHHRRSIRLRNYDYANPGAYFVTICTQYRECLFGDVVYGEMKLNDIGNMVKRVWHQLQIKYSNVEIDEFIVMPNHMHGIIVFPVGAGPCACPETRAPNETKMINVPKNTGLHVQRRPMKPE